MREATGNLKPFEDFYRFAEKRDAAMAERFLAQTPEKGVSVLVTGGFHGTSIRRRLMEKGCAVVTFVPRVSKIDGAGSDYLAAFLQEKTPLDNLFEGRQLYLTPNPALGLHKLAALPALFGSQAARLLRAMFPTFRAIGTPTIRIEGNTRVARLGVEDEVSRQHFSEEVAQTGSDIVSLREKLGSLPSWPLGAARALRQFTANGLSLAGKAIAALARALFDLRQFPRAKKWVGATALMLAALEWPTTALAAGNGNGSFTLGLGAMALLAWAIMSFRLTPPSPVPGPLGGTGRTMARPAQGADADSAALLRMLIPARYRGRVAGSLPFDFVMELFRFVASVDKVDATGEASRSIRKRGAADVQLLALDRSAWRVSYGPSKRMGYLKYGKDLRSEKLNYMVAEMLGVNVCPREMVRLGDVIVPAETETEWNEYLKNAGLDPAQLGKAEALLVGDTNAVVSVDDLNQKDNSGREAIFVYQALMGDLDHAAGHNLHTTVISGIKRYLLFDLEKILEPGLHRLFFDDYLRENVEEIDPQRISDLIRKVEAIPLHVFIEMARDAGFEFAADEINWWEYHQRKKMLRENIILALEDSLSRVNDSAGRLRIGDVIQFLRNEEALRREDHANERSAFADMLLRPTVPQEKPIGGRLGVAGKTLLTALIAFTVMEWPTNAHAATGGRGSLVLGLGLVLLAWYFAGGVLRFAQERGEANRPRLVRFYEAVEDESGDLLVAALRAAGVTDENLTTTARQPWIDALRRVAKDNKALRTPKELAAALRKNSALAGRIQDPAQRALFASQFAEPEIEVAPDIALPVVPAESLPVISPPSEMISVPSIPAQQPQPISRDESIAPAGHAKPFLTTVVVGTRDGAVIRESRETLSLADPLAQRGRELMDRLRSNDSLRAWLDELIGTVGADNFEIIWVTEAERRAGAHDVDWQMGFGASTNFGPELYPTGPIRITLRLHENLSQPDAFVTLATQLALARTCCVFEKPGAISQRDLMLPSVQGYLRFRSLAQVLLILDEINAPPADLLAISNLVLQTPPQFLDVTGAVGERELRRVIGLHPDAARHQASLDRLSVYFRSKPELVGIVEWTQRATGFESHILQQGESAVAEAWRVIRTAEECTVIALKGEREIRNIRDDFFAKPGAERLVGVLERFLAPHLNVALEWMPSPNMPGGEAMESAYTHVYPARTTMTFALNRANGGAAAIFMQLVVRFHPWISRNLPEILVHEFVESILVVRLAEAGFINTAGMGWLQKSLFTDWLTNLATIRLRSQFDLPPSFLAQNAFEAFADLSSVLEHEGELRAELLKKDRRFDENAVACLLWRLEIARAFSDRHPEIPRLIAEARAQYQEWSGTHPPISQLGWQGAGIRPDQTAEFLRLADELNQLTETFGRGPTYAEMLGQEEAPSFPYLLDLIPEKTTANPSPQAAPLPPGHPYVERGQRLLRRVLADPVMSEALAFLSNRENVGRVSIVWSDGESPDPISPSMKPLGGASATLNSTMRSSDHVVVRLDAITIRIDPRIASDDQLVISLIHELAETELIARIIKSGRLTETVYDDLREKGYSDWRTFITQMNVATRLGLPLRERLYTAVAFLQIAAQLSHMPGFGAIRTGLRTLPDGTRRLAQIYTCLIAMHERTPFLTRVVPPQAVGWEAINTIPVADQEPLIEFVQNLASNVDLKKDQDVQLMKRRMVDPSGNDIGKEIDVFTNSRLALRGQRLLTRLLIDPGVAPLWEELVAGTRNRNVRLVWQSEPGLDVENPSASSPGWVAPPLRIPVYTTGAAGLTGFESWEFRMPAAATDEELWNYLVRDIVTAHTMLGYIRSQDLFLEEFAREEHRDARRAIVAQELDSISRRERERSGGLEAPAAWALVFGPLVPLIGLGRTIALAAFSEPGAFAIILVFLRRPEGMSRTFALALALGWAVGNWVIHRWGGIFVLSDKGILKIVRAGDPQGPRMRVVRGALASTGIGVLTVIPVAMGWYARQSPFEFNGLILIGIGLGMVAWSIFTTLVPLSRRSLFGWLQHLTGRAPPFYAGATFLAGCLAAAIGMESSPWVGLLAGVALGGTLHWMIFLYHGNWFSGPSERLLPRQIRESVARALDPSRRLPGSAIEYVLIGLALLRHHHPFTGFLRTERVPELFAAVQNDPAMSLLVVEIAAAGPLAPETKKAFLRRAASTLRSVSGSGIRRGRLFHTEGDRLVIALPSNEIDLVEGKLAKDLPPLSVNGAPVHFRMGIGSRLDDALAGMRDVDAAPEAPPSPPATSRAPNPTLLKIRLLLRKIGRVLAERIDPLWTRKREQRFWNEHRAQPHPNDIDSLTGLFSGNILARVIERAEEEADTSVVVFRLEGTNLLGTAAEKSRAVLAAAAALRGATENGLLTQQVFRDGGYEFVVSCPSRHAEEIQTAAESLFQSPVAGVTLRGAVAKTRTQAKNNLDERLVPAPAPLPPAVRREMDDDRLLDLNAQINAAKWLIEKSKTAEVALDSSRAAIRLDRLSEIARLLSDNYRDQPELLEFYLDNVGAAVAAIDPFDLNRALASRRGVLALSVLNLAARAVPRPILERELRRLAEVAHNWKEAKTFWYLPGTAIVVEDVNLSVKQRDKVLAMAPYLAQMRADDGSLPALARVESIGVMNENAMDGGQAGALGHPLINLAGHALDAVERLLHEGQHQNNHAEKKSIESWEMNTGVEDLPEDHEWLNFPSTPFSWLDELAAYAEGTEARLNYMDEHGFDLRRDAEAATFAATNLALAREAIDRLNDTDGELNEEGVAWLSQLTDRWSVLEPRILAYLVRTESQLRALSKKNKIPRRLEFVYDTAEDLRQITFHEAIAQHREAIEAQRAAWRSKKAASKENEEDRDDSEPRGPASPSAPADAAPDTGSPETGKAIGPDDDLARVIVTDRDFVVNERTEGALSDVFPEMERLPLNGLVGKDRLSSVLVSESGTGQLAASLRGGKRNRFFNLSDAFRILRRYLGLGTELSADQLLGDHVALPLVGGNADARALGWQFALAMFQRLDENHDLFLWIDRNEATEWETLRVTLPTDQARRVHFVERRGGFVDSGVLTGSRLLDGLALTAQNGSANVVKSLTVMIPPNVGVNLPATFDEAWLGGARLALLQSLSTFLRIDVQRLKNLGRLARILAAQA